MFHRFKLEIFRLEKLCALQHHLAQSSIFLRLFLPMVSAFSRHHQKDQLLMQIRFAARTLDVYCDAAKHVHHVWRIARGPANTKESVICHVPRHVAAFHVTSDVLEYYPAAIAARDCVAKHARKPFVKHVQFIKRSE